MLVARFILVFALLVGAVSLVLYLITGNRAYLQALSRGVLLLLLMGVIVVLATFVGRYFGIIL